MKPTPEMNAMKDKADKFIDTLSRFSEAIVAGGFARDYILWDKYNVGTNPNDIDVYVKYTKELKEYMYLRAKEGKCYEMTKHYDGLNSLDSVFCFDTAAKIYHDDVYKGDIEDWDYDRVSIQVQVILLRTDLELNEYVDRHFDLSICKAIYDGDCFIELPDFTRSVEDKKIYFNDQLGADETMYCFKKHMAKITCRFKGLGFDCDNYNPNFKGERYKCDLVLRSRLADKMIGKNKWLYKTEKYYYYDKDGGL